MKAKIKGKLIWKSQRQQEKELTEKIKSWKEGFSKDGFIISGEGKFIYRKIAYLVKVMRYYNHLKRFTTLTSDRISQYHSVVESPEETLFIHDLIPYEFRTDFLYHDTLHSWNEKQPKAKQINYCHKLAMQDIDNLLDGDISRKVQEMIDDLKKKKNELDSEIKKFKKGKK